MHLKLSSSCPISFTPPFVSPWRRALEAGARHRLMSWTEEVLPGADVDIVEWVGADPRHPIHAVVVSFPSSHRPPAVLYMKVEDVQRRHLHEALWAQREMSRAG